MEDSVKLSGLMCPQCGGNLSLKEGANIVNCLYCNSSLLLIFKEGIIKYYLPASINRNKALEKVRQLFEHEEAAEELRSEAVLSDISLYYIPYWRFKTGIFGMVEGIETIDRSRKFRLTQADESTFARDFIERAIEPIVKRSVSKKVKNIMIINISASNMGDYGIPNLNSFRQRSSGMEVYKRMNQFPEVGLLQKSELKDAIVIDRMYSKDIAEAEADRIIMQFMETRGSGLDEYMADVREIRRRVSLLYYPLWLCKFKFRGRFYRAAIDGLNGKVISAIIPQQQKGRILGILGVSLLLGWGVSTVLRGLFFSGELAKLLFLHPLSWFVLFIVFLALGAFASIALKVFYEEKDLTIEG